MIGTGEDHIQSIGDGREDFMDREKLSDGPSHSLIKPLPVSKHRSP
jgi:hypothetical protein